MSTKKTETKKPVAVKKPEEKKELPKSGLYMRKEDGTLDKVDETALLKHKHTLITITDMDDKLKTETFGIEYGKQDDNYTFSFLTSDKLIDTIEKVADCDVTFIGRGEYAKALYAAHSAWRAFGDAFGITKAYKLVRLALDYKTRTWKALFASAIDILS